MMEEVLKEKKWWRDERMNNEGDGENEGKRKARGSSV